MENGKKKSQNKTKLYKDNEKTGACNLIETYLRIQVSLLLHVTACVKTAIEGY